MILCECGHSFEVDDAKPLTHRLLCGDSTDAGDVERVELPDDLLVVTDPPYSSGARQEGLKRNSTSIGTRSDHKIQRDNLTSRGYMELLRLTIQLSSPGTAYVFTDWRMWTWTSDVLEACGLSVRNMIVWDKNQMGMGFPWRNQHELIAFGKSSSAQIMDGKKGNVLRHPRTGNVNHETEKPVALACELIENSEPGNAYDPFLGSGTTLVACENLGRRGFGIEISPGYVAVALERMTQLGCECEVK